MYDNRNWKEYPFDSRDVSSIVSMLIRICPDLDALRKVKRGLDSYLSVYEKDESS